MKKKVVAIVLSILVIASLCFGLVACNGSSDENYNVVELSTLEGMTNPDYSSLTVPSNYKAGLICLHDENSTYDKNFIDAFKSACDELGISYLIKTNIGETNACYTAAVELADAGCKTIFADSFGHESFIMQAAREYPNIQFCHATGYQAATSELSNFHDAFASIYEGRYLAGVAAGLKLNEMIANGKITASQAKIGYVGAWTYAEVISGYTSFYLGAKSVCSTATMEVTFTGSWYDETAEKEGANALINRGCVLISQHADSMGAPSACELAGVPNVSYNGSTVTSCPTTFIVSSKINWAPYFKYAMAATINGTAIDTDWTGTLKTNSVQLTGINMDVAAEGTIAKLEEVRAQLAAGTLHVFDNSTFTVVAADQTAYAADAKNTDGYYHESVGTSAPSFAYGIEGITLLNTKY